MAKDSPAPKNNLMVFAVMGLAILLLVILVISSSRNASETEETGGEEAPASQEAPAKEGETTGGSEDRSGEPVAEPSEPGGELAEGLPANWNELSSLEKIALNPFDCPVDEDGIIRLSAETGECLGGDAGSSEDDGGGEEAGRPPAVPGDALVLGLGEAFAYNAASEITVTGIDCTNLDALILYPKLNLSFRQVLEERGDDYEAYKASPSALTRNYLDRGESLVYLGYFEYLQGFERWLAANAPASSGDLADRLFGYLDCKISLKLKNVGEDSYFPDGCGWKFDGRVSVVGKRRTYGSENRDRLSTGPVFCSAAVVDFPNGATDDDSFSFIIDSDDEILEIIIWGDGQAFRVVKSGS